MSVGDLTGFVSHEVAVDGMAHHVLEWPGDASKTVLWLHGYLDQAQSFARVIARVGAHGYRVLAPDFRGHGRSSWAPRGSYYHFPDYVADVDALVDHFALDALSVVAHSMGGSVATRWVGARPERCKKLALLEGIGPPSMPADVAVDRTTGWLDQLRKHRARKPRVMASLNDAYLRLRISHPSIDEAILREVATFATRPAKGEEGWLFRFDPLHQTTSPGRVDHEAFEAFVDRIVCPVLLVDGGDVSLWPEYDSRAARFKTGSRVALEGGGHMMHWTVPDLLADTVAAFLSREDGERAGP